MRSVALFVWVTWTCVELGALATAIVMWITADLAAARDPAIVMLVAHYLASGVEGLAAKPVTVR